MASYHEVGWEDKEGGGSEVYIEVQGRFVMHKVSTCLAVATDDHVRQLWMLCWERLQGSWLYIDLPLGC